MGDNLPDFLNNINRLHTHLIKGAHFPEVNFPFRPFLYLLPFALLADQRLPPTAMTMAARCWSRSTPRGSACRGESRTHSCFTTPQARSLGSATAPPS